MRSNSSFDFRPRPPETTFSAVARSGLSDLARSSLIHSVAQAELGSSPSEREAFPPVAAPEAKAVPRTVTILGLSLVWTVRIAFPA